MQEVFYRLLVWFEATVRTGFHCTMFQIVSHQHCTLGCPNPVQCEARYANVY